MIVMYRRYVEGSFPANSMVLLKLAFLLGKIVLVFYAVGHFGCQTDRYKIRVAKLHGHRGDLRWFLISGGKAQVKVVTR